MNRQSERYDQFIPTQEIDVYALAASPNGRLIAWAGPDGLIRIWNLVTQEEERTIYMSQGATVRVLTFSPDNEILYSADTAGTIALWDVETWRKLRDFTADISLVSEIYAMALSPDGTTLAYGGRAEGDSNVYTRNLVTGVLKSYRPTRAGIEDTLAVAWSPDGKVFASAGRDRVIRIWDPQTRREVETIRTILVDNTLQEVYEGPIHSLAFSPDGKWLVSGGEDNEGGVKDKTLMMWDTTLWAEQPPVIFQGGPNSDITVIKFSPDGQTLASAYNNGEIVTWNFASQNLTEEITSHTGTVLAMDFSQFEKSLLLVSSGYDRTILMNNLIALDTLDTTLVDQKGSPTRLAMASADELTIAGTTQAGLSVWTDKLASGQEDQIDLGDLAGQSDFYLSPDSRQVAWVSNEAGIEIFALDSQQELLSIPLPTVAISTTNANGETSESQEPGQVDSLAFNPDGNTLAGAYCRLRSRENVPGTENVIDICVERAILVWDIPGGGLKKMFSTGKASAIRSLAFKPGNDNNLAVGYQDASIQIWDIDQERASGLPLIGIGGPVTSLAFHQDGDVLASGSENKLIALWNMNPPQLIGGPFTGSDGAVTGLAFSPDNSILYSGSDAGTISQWDIEAWKQLACRLAGRNLSRAEWEQFFLNEPYRATCDQFPIQTPEVTPAPSTPTPTP